MSNLLKESYDGFKQSPASDAFIEKCFETVKSFYRQEWVNGSCVAKEQAKQFQKFAEGCANRSLVTISKLLKQVNQIGPLLSHPPGDLDHVVGTSPPEGGGGGGGAVAAPLLLITASSPTLTMRLCATCSGHPNVIPRY